MSSSSSEDTEDNPTFADDEGLFPIHNPEGDSSLPPDKNWILQAIDKRAEIVIMAHRFHKAGHSVVLSRSGTSKDKLALYTEEEESETAPDDYPVEVHPGNTQDRRSWDPDGENSVTFGPYNKVQYFQSEKHGLSGKKEHQPMETQLDSETEKKPDQSHKPQSREEDSSDTDDQSSKADAELSESSDSSVPSSSSSSSQSSGVSTSSNEPFPSDDDSGISFTPALRSPPKSKMHKRRPSLTKDILSDTKQMVVQNPSTHASGGDPGQHD